MATEGVLFENAFTMQSVCGPVRACLQTGLYATQTGCYRNGITLPGVKTLADHFHETGYQTAYVGKWHLTSTDDPQYMHPNADALQRQSANYHTLPVPLVACGPGFKGGRKISHMVSLQDLPPTLLGCAGPPAGMQGRSLQPLLDGSGNGWEENIFLQISETQVGRAVRTRKWKYSVRD